MASDLSFELVTIFSMKLSVQYFSYVQHIGNTTVHIPLFSSCTNRLSKNVIMLNLISFQIQICCQDQHLELLGNQQNKHNISDQRCMIISVNNYQLPLKFGLRHGNMFEITKHLFLGVFHRYFTHNF